MSDDRTFVRECGPVWGSCTLASGHAGLHDGNRPRVYPCAAGNCRQKVAERGMICAACVDGEAGDER